MGGREAGIAALILAVIGWFVPFYGMFISGVAILLALLAAFGDERTFSSITSIVVWTNLYFASPLFWAAVQGAQIRTGFPSEAGYALVYAFVALPMLIAGIKEMRQGKAGSTVRAPSPSGLHSGSSYAGTADAGEDTWRLIADKGDKALLDEFLRLFPGHPRSMQARLALERVVKGPGSASTGAPNAAAATIDWSEDADKIWTMIDATRARDDLEEFIRRFPDHPRVLIAKTLRASEAPKAPGQYDRDRVVAASAHSPARQTPPAMSADDRRAIVRSVFGLLAAGAAAGGVWLAYVYHEHYTIMQAAKARQEAIARDPANGIVAGNGTTFRDNLKNGEACAFCPEMVVVPAGEFLMGSPDSEIGRDQNEGPQTKVTVPRRFAVGRYSITFEQWDVCQAEKACSTYLNGYLQTPDQGWGRGLRPVVNVAWGQAHEFARWLSRKTGRTYRLPTEAEREYFTRAGTTTAYWWGDRFQPQRVIHKDSWAGGQSGTAVVGALGPNPWGLSNVLGNVWEHTDDGWADRHQGGEQGSTRRSSNSGATVVRGGSYGSAADRLRSATRQKLLDQVKYADIGFRLVRDVED